MAERNRLRRQNGIVAGVCEDWGEFHGSRLFGSGCCSLFPMVPGGLPGLVPYDSVVGDPAQA